MTDRIFIQGEEIRWREDSRKRTWHVGFVVGQRNQWIVVRMPNGDEQELHPRDVKKIV